MAHRYGTVKFDLQAPMVSLFIDDMQVHHEFKTGAASLLESSSLFPTSSQARSGPQLEEPKPFH